MQQLTDIFCGNDFCGDLVKLFTTIQKYLYVLEINYLLQ